MHGRRGRRPRPNTTPKHLRFYHHMNDPNLAIQGAQPQFASPLHVGRPNEGGRQQLLDRVEGMLDRRWFANDGPLVKEFETRVQEFLGVKHCIAAQSLRLC